MAFHFPLMPRLFMALQHGGPLPDRRHPRSRRRSIPESCQWALFLRNHDELTLEMVTDEERDYMYRVYASDRAGAHQPRHPPPPGAAARQRPPQDRADERPAVLAAGHAGHLLRRRDRHGRQRLPRRPRRRAHADAVERRPQRRLLARQPAAAVPAADHRPRVPLRGGQRRGAAAQPELAAVVDEAADRAAQALPRCSAGATSSSSHPDNRKVLAFVRSYDDEQRSWSSPTCRASRSTSSSTCRSSAARCRSSFSAAPPSRRSASCRTCSRSARTPSTGWPIETADVTEDADDVGFPVIEASGSIDALVTGRRRGELERAIARFLPGRRWFAGKARVIRNVSVVSTPCRSPARAARWARAS